MNSDRLTQMSSDIIVTGLTNKWTDAYSFLGFDFSSITTDNGVTFDSLNKNQFALDLAYYLEPEDILFLLFQVKDKFIQVTDGATIIQLTENNLKQILVHKWIKAITQLNSILNSVSVQDDFITYNFVLDTTDLSSKVEGELFAINELLSNYFEKYADYNSQNLVYPNTSLTYKINWDVIKSRFSSRMRLGWSHNLTLNKSEFKSLVGKKLSLTGYVDGVPNTDLTFTSSDSNIATVDAGGLVTLISLGNCSVTVTDTNFNTQAICLISVIDKELFVDQSVINLRTGTKKINAFINGVKLTNITFSSSDSNIVIVSQDGIVSKGTQEGTCFITVLDNISGLSKTCKVNNRPESFSAEFKSKLIEYGNSIKLKLYYNDSYTKNVTYQVSDVSIATINNGILTAGNTKGSCVITATHIPSNKTVSFTINTTKNSVFVSCGNLQSLLGTNYLTITDLVLSGYLNSSDVQTILNMAQTGTLKTLDFERCNFIVDKNGYAIGASNNKYITSTKQTPPYFLYKSTKLTSAIISKNISMINDGCFSTSAITSIVIPSNIKEIGTYVFELCTSLSSIVFEDSYLPLTIRYRAFSYWGNVTVTNSLTLPARTVYIEGGILDFSNGIKNLTVLSTTPPTLTGGLGGGLNNIYVPSQSVAAYKAASGWSTHASIIKAIV